MSFFAKAESPALNPATPDRRNTYAESESLPFGNGYFRVAPKWITDRFNDHWSNGKTTGQAYCSVAGVLCHGPIQHVRGLYVGGDLAAVLDVSRPTNPADPDYYYTTIEFGGIDADLGITNRVRFYWGDEAQPADSWLISTTGQDHPAYCGQTLVIFERLHCGQIQANSQARPALPNIEFTVYRLPSPSMPSGLRFPSALPGGVAQFRGINLVSAVWDAFTHPRAGLGITSTILDQSDWETKAAGLESGAKAAAGMYGSDAYVSPLLTGQTDADKFSIDAMAYVDGWLFAEAGKIRMDWFANDGTVPGSLPEISEHDHVEPPTVRTGSLAESPTSIVVKLLEGDSGELDLIEAVETAQVPFVRELGAGNKPQNLQRPWFTSRAIGAKYGARAAATATVPTMTGESVVRLDSAVRLDNTPLRIGDIFKVNYAPLSLLVVARLVERLEDETTATLRWDRERGAPELPYTPATDPRIGYVLPDPPTPGTGEWVVIEAPAGLSETAAAIILAERPSDTLAGMRIYLDLDNDWSAGSTLLGIQGFAAKVTLDTTINSSATSCILDGTGVDVSSFLGSGVTSVEQDDDALMLFMGSEWMTIGAVSSAGAGSYNAAIKRGRLQSTAAAHTAADVGWVIRRDRIALWASTTFTPLSDRYFKVAYYHALADGPLSASKQVTFANRAPNPPTSFAAAALPGAVKLSWVVPTGNNLFGYQIYQNTTNSIPGSPSYFVAHAGNVFTVPGLTAGTAYYFWIVALTDTIGVSTTVGSVTATPTSASAGPAGAAGTGAWLPVTSGTATITGSDVFKLTGSAAWDASIYSRDGFYRGAFMGCTCGALGNVAFGLDATPASSDNNTSLDYSFRLWSGGQIDIVESGSTVASSIGTQIANTTRFVVVYDNASVRYYVDGVLKRTVSVAADQTLFLDSSLNTVDATNPLLKNLVFGATGAVGPTGSTGPTGAAGAGYAATSTTSRTIGTGVLSWTLTPTTGAWTAGQRVRVIASSGNWCEGAVLSYNSGTGSITVDVTLTSGSGTHATWTVSLAGEQGSTGPTGPTGSTGAQGPGFAATSTTSLTIGTGSKSLTTQTGLAYTPGQTVRLISTASPENWMEGVISAYTTGTGAMTFASSLYQGSGTIASWTLANVGMSGTGGTPDGIYVAGTTYYCNSVRQSIVYVGTSAYRAVNPAKDGLTTWGTPGSSSDWAAPDATLKFSATDLALVRDQTVTRTLVMGDGSSGAGIIRWNTATNFSTGNGIWMGYDGTSIKARFGDPAGYNWSFDTSTGEIIEKVRRVIVGDSTGADDTVGDIQLLGNYSSRKFGTGSQNTGLTATVAQGTIASPSATASGSFAALRMRGYDGSAYVTAGNIRIKAQSTWSVGNNPTEIEFLVSDGAGNHSVYVTKDGRLKTEAPSGGTSGEWKLGTVATVSPTSPNRTIEVEIGGTTYYLHAKTTNN